jgi:L-threonylcarbamoyladenylate synthase
MEIGHNIIKAAEFLRQGKLVGMPTETVYGLAAIMSNDQAVLSVFEAKNRPAFDPLIVHIAEMHWLDDLASEIPDAARFLANRIWPGPLTLLLKKSEKVSDLVSAGNSTVAVRMPQHPMALELMRKLGEPVVAPSANPFGYVSPTEAMHVFNQLGDKVAYILEGGSAAIGLESTIVSFIETKPQILRLGGISVEEMSEYLGEVPELKIATHSNPQAPGQLDRHYATRIPLILCDDILLKAQNFAGKKLSLLSFQSRFDSIPWIQKEILSAKGDLREAARNLFASMRRLDQGKSDFILAEYFPDVGLGRAINDRLKRASFGFSGSGNSGEV